MVRADERRKPEYPFTSAWPVEITSRGWGVVLLGVAVAIAALMLIPVPSFEMSLLVAALFPGIPLLALSFVVGRHWTALFDRIGSRHIGIMLLTALATMVASAIAAIIVQWIATTASNPLGTAIQGMTGSEYIRRLVPTAPQLVGEELITILPFLAILWVATQRAGIAWGRSTGLALLGSTAIFAAVHLPTYDWNVAQCFGVIGTARIVLTLSYIWTRNLWVPIGAHILNDWTEFTFIFALGHVPVGTSQNIP